MKKILGLDLGTNSIGWALVNEAENDTEKSSIIKIGVRTIRFDNFCDSSKGKELKGDPSLFFSKGKGVSPNTKRTLKRSARRNLQRYKLRRERLINTMLSAKIITPETCLSESNNFSTFETYKLRAKAVSKEITLEQFARVLLMINKKRGYKSNRKLNNKEEGTIINEIDIARKLKEEKLTPGELCADLLNKGTKELPSFYLSDLQIEFNRIWECQRGFYNNILTDTLKNEVFGKDRNQTWGILTNHFIWSETTFEWNEEKACNIEIIKEHKLTGIKRTAKGYELKKENYEWRRKAIHEKINPEELAIVIQEINHDIRQSSSYLGAISDHSKVICLQNKTIGQYLMSSIIKNPNVSLKSIVFYRQDYINEFNLIWDAQAKYHKELTNELKIEIRDKIIFYQRKLRSQKGLVSYCEFEQEEKEIIKNGKKKTIIIGSKVTPRSSPLFQEFKIWQQLNNIILFRNENHEHRPLLQEEKELLARELSIKENLSKTEILNLLFKGEDRTNFNINYKNLDGNKTGYALFKAYSEILKISGHDPINFKSTFDEIINQVKEIFSLLGIKTDFLFFNFSKEYKDQAYYKLWHLLYSFEGDNSKTGTENLINKLIERTSMDRKYATILSNVTFQNDYGNLSSKAIANILPHLKDGNSYDVACLYAGYRHSKWSLTKTEREQKKLKDELNILPKNTLRNPVVEKVLNQMVNVVNSILHEYGRPDAIRIELARELKKNATEREHLSNIIEATTKKHQEYVEVLKGAPFNLKHVSRNDIILYKLYLELEPNGFKTLYSDTYIPKEKLFSGIFDREHIIPKARLFDDSISNQTIELKSINQEKGKTTAYDFVLQKYGKDYSDKYKNKCETLFNKNTTKLKKLLMRENEIPENFIERDLRNTQYITRTALKMLNDICAIVSTTTGSITKRLRNDWQIIDVIKELNIGKYRKLGAVETFKDKNGRTVNKIKNWSKRDDHRHHAMDAVAIAFTKDAFVQYYNNVNASQNPNTIEYAIKNKYFNNGKALPPIPLDKFRLEIIQHMEDVLISIKSNNKVSTNNKTKNGKKGTTKIQLTPRGQLHDDTIYGCIKQYETKVEKINASFNEEKINHVAKKTYKEALLQRLREFNNNPKEAFTNKNSLNKNPIWLDANHTQKVPDTVKLVYIKNKITKRTTIDKNINLDKIIDKKSRQLIEEHIKEYGVDALTNLERNPIWVNKDKNIIIKNVTILAKDQNLDAIHYKRNKDGQLIYDKTTKQTIPNDFVNKQNNHHAIIYRRPIIDKSGNIKLDHNGCIQYELEQRIISFYEAVERKNQGLPIIDKTYKVDEGWEFVFSMKKNEYFVFPNINSNFNPTEIDLTNPQNLSLISPNLYRVESISHNDYFFRHHLDATTNKSLDLKEHTWKRIRSLSNLNDVIKVRINHIGQIVEIGES